MLSPNSSFNVFERIKLPQITFSDQRGQLGIDSKIKRIFLEIKNLGKLGNALARNTPTTKQITMEIRKYFS